MNTGALPIRREREGRLAFRADEPVDLVGTCGVDGGAIHAAVEPATRLTAGMGGYKRVGEEAVLACKT